MLKNSGTRILKKPKKKKHKECHQFDGLVAIQIIMV